MDEKKFDEDTALIEHTRGTVLSKLVGLVSEVRDIIRKSHSEIAVVVEDGRRVVP